MLQLTSGKQNAFQEHLIQNSFQEHFTKG